MHMYNNLDYKLNIYISEEESYHGRRCGQVPPPLVDCINLLYLLDQKGQCCQPLNRCLIDKL